MPSDRAADTLSIGLQRYYGPGYLLRLNHPSRPIEDVPQTLLKHCHTENGYFALPPFPTLMAFKILVTTCQDADLLVQARVTNRDLASLQKSLAQYIINPRINRENNNPSTSFPPPLLLHWAALLIYDTAQATELDILIPLTVIMPPLTPSSAKPIFVLAGDLQRPDVVSQSTTTLATSYFERIRNTQFYFFHPRVVGAGLVPMYIPPFAGFVGDRKEDTIVGQG